MAGGMLATIAKGEGDMSRKLVLIWAVVVLPLAIILSGCGGDSTSGPSDEEENGEPPKWNVTQQTSGVEAALRGIFFDPDTGHGWVVGMEGVILHTTDKGVNWENQESGVAGDLYCVYFVNENEGWAAGDGGTVIHTVDGGAIWELQNAGISEGLRGMFFENNMRGWVVGGGGKIITTEDGGVEWSEQDSGKSLTLEAVDFAPLKQGETRIEKGWAVGENGTIIHTKDGEHWAIQITRTTESIYGVSFVNEDNGWAVGKKGTVLSTKDGGVDWGRSAAAAAKSRSLYDVLFMDVNDGWCVSSGGKLLHSDGQYWEAVDTGITTQLWGVAFITSEGWAIGDAGVILHVESAQ